MTKLAPFAQPGKFWRGNLHTHSTLSDGALPPEEVIRRYRAQGYDFLVLSEHFIQNFNWPIADTRAFRIPGFTTIIGAELHAPETSAGELWHILATGLPLDFAPASPGEDGPALARRAKAAGAFISIAHPSWSRYTIEDGRALLGSADAVEIYNHGCEIENDLGYGWYLHDQLLNEGNRLTAVATDDAHFKTPDHFGGWVNVKSDSLEPGALLAALKAGHFYSSQGPEIHSVDLEGNAISITCTPASSITVVCGTSRTCVKVGKDLTSAEFDLATLNRGWLLKKPSDWIRVTVIDAQGRKAWSNAIWRNS